MHNLKLCCEDELRVWYFTYEIVKLIYEFGFLIYI